MNLIRAFAVVLGGAVSLVTCAVLRSRGQEAEQARDRWYTERAEGRLLALRDEQAAYRRFVTALVAEDAVREAEAIVREGVR